MGFELTNISVERWSTCSYCSCPRRVCSCRPVCSWLSNDFDILWHLTCTVSFLTTVSPQLTATLPAMSSVCYIFFYSTLNSRGGRQRDWTKWFAIDEGPYPRHEQHIIHSSIRLFGLHSARNCPRERFLSSSGRKPKQRNFETRVKIFLPSPRFLILISFLWVYVARDMVQAAIPPAHRRRSSPVVLLHQWMNTRTVSSKLRSKSPRYRRSSEKGKASTRLASSPPSRLIYPRKVYQRSIKSRAVSRSMFTNATSKPPQKPVLPSFCLLLSPSKPRPWWLRWPCDIGVNTIVKMGATRGCSSTFWYMDYSLCLRASLERFRLSPCGFIVHWGVQNVCTIR